jgi:hypothetical protein
LSISQRLLSQDVGIVWLQVPDFTSLLSSELEASAFAQATGAVNLGGTPDSSSKAPPAGKVFLFSTKQEVPGVYKALAMQLHGKANLMFAWTTPESTGPGPALMKKMNVSPVCLAQLESCF